MNMNQKQKILIVDDKKANLLALRKVLMELDVEIIEATGGNEALAATLEHDFAIAILDVMMPGMDGYELAGYLKGDAKTRDIPIIFLTAVSADDERIFKGYDVGAVDYIVKPYNPVVLLSKVRVFLELERVRAQLVEKIEALTRSEEALRESEALYRAIARNFPDGAVYIFDHDLRFRVADGKAMAPLGYKREDLEGKTIWEAIDEETCRILEQRYPRVLAGESLHFETSLKGCTFLSGYVPIRDENGDVIAGMVVSHDISALKQAEEGLRRMHDELEARVKERTAELEAMNSELHNFTFAASHDLQEPLRKIRTFGDMLVTEAKGSLDEASFEYVSRMQNSAERMQKLLDSLLAYSRVSTGVVSGKETDLKKSVEGAISNLELIIKENNARIETGDLPTIVADRSQIIQLFQNLIGNALKYQKSGVAPRVKIYLDQAASEEKGTYEVCVKDNGIGIDERYFDKIFIPFQRLHGRNEYEGVGMGLAICSKIVERHGGRITLKSELGKGSTFIVTLPVEGKGR